MCFGPFHHDPPAGWHGLARGLQTDWYPLDYPANRCAISVYPATPARAPFARIIEARLALDSEVGFQPTAVGEPSPLVSDHGLHGEIVNLEGDKDGLRFERQLAAFQDARYAYAAILDCAAAPTQRDAARGAFAALLRSCRPLPAPPGAELAAALGHWAH